MKALAPVLVELGETKLLNDIEALLNSQAHPYALGEFQLVREHGLSNGSRSFSGITMIEVEQGGNRYKLLWKNRNQFKMVPVDEYRKEMFDKFVKLHGIPAERVFTKELRDKNYPRI